MQFSVRGSSCACATTLHPCKCSTTDWKPYRIRSYVYTRCRLLCWHRTGARLCRWRSVLHNYKHLREEVILLGIYAYMPTSIMRQGHQLSRYRGGCRCHLQAALVLLAAVLVLLSAKNVVGGVSGMFKEGRGFITSTPVVTSLDSGHPTWQVSLTARQACHRGTHASTGARCIVLRL